MITPAWPTPGASAALLVARHRLAAEDDAGERERGRAEREHRAHDWHRREHHAEHDAHERNHCEQDRAHCHGRQIPLHAPERQAERSERLAADALGCAACRTPPNTRAAAVPSSAGPTSASRRCSTRLLGQKLAIATPKPQTTRTCILGVYVQKEPPLQIAFVDTPGLHEPQNALGRALLEQAKAGVSRRRRDAAGGASRPERQSQRGARPARAARCSTVCAAAQRPVVLAINKVDRLKHKPLLLPSSSACSQAFPFAAIVPISARTAAACTGWSARSARAARGPALRRGRAHRQVRALLRRRARARSCHRAHASKSCRTRRRW